MLVSFSVAAKLAASQEGLNSMSEIYISGRDPQWAWCQDELIGGKPPVVK
jgi:hypothetical protein